MYDFNSFDSVAKPQGGMPVPPKKKDKYDFDSFDNSVKKKGLGGAGLSTVPSTSSVSGGLSSVNGGEVGSSNIPSKESEDINSQEFWDKRGIHPMQLQESTDPLNDALSVAVQHLDQLKKEEWTPDHFTKIKDATKAVKDLSSGNVIPNGDVGKQLFLKLTNSNPDNLSKEQIDAITPNTLSGKAAAKSYLSLRNIKESLENNSSLDDAAIDVAIKNGDSGLEQLRSSLGGNTSAIGNATKGEKLSELLTDKNFQYLAQTDPKVHQAYKEALFNLPNHYPEAAVTTIKQLIADKLEKNGDNNFFYNITSKDKASKIVDDAIKNDELPANYKPLFDKEVKPKLGTWQQLVHGNPIPTPGLLENVSEGAQNMLLGTGKTVAEITGLRDLYKSPTQQLSETVEKDYNTPNVTPQGLLHKTSMQGGQLLGAILGMAPMASSISELGVGKETANALAFGLGVSGDYNDQSKKLFSSPLKQAIYTNTMTALNMWGAKFLPGGKILKDEEPNIVNTLKEVLSGKTPIDEGKQKIINGLVGAAKGGLAGGEFMAATTAADDILSQTLQNKNPKLSETLEKTAQAFSSGFLATSFLGGAEGLLKNNKGVKEQIYAMSSNPEHFAEVIKSHVPQEQQEDILKNLDYISSIKKSLDETKMNDAQKQNYIVRALNEKIKTGKVENITEPTLNKIENDKIKKSQEINSNLLRGIPEEKTVENQAKKTVKEFYDNNLLPKADNMLLEKPPQTEGGEPKYDEEKAKSYLKYIAQQANGLDENGEPLKGGARSNNMKHYPTQLIEAANEMFPDYAKVERINEEPPIKESVPNEENLKDIQTLEENRKLDLASAKTSDEKSQINDYYDNRIKLINGETNPSTDIPIKTETKEPTTSESIKESEGAGTKPPDQTIPVTEGEQDATSIKNETTRLRREQFGLEKEIPTAKKEFGETWDEAKLKIENGYDPQDLIDELHKKPRPLNDVENAILLHHQNSKEIDLLDTNKGINEASEKGDEQTVQELKTHKARLLDELQRIYDVDKAVGTENARGLSSRQMMVDRKYSLVNMIAEKRATANDGKPLSEEQKAEVEKLHQKIQETKKEYEDYVKEAESEIKGLQEKILGKGVKDKKSAATKLRELAAKVEKSNVGKATLPKGTQLQGTSVDINKMVAQGMRLIADGLEKGEEVLDLVKKAVKKLKEDNPDIDEFLLTKKINKAVIDANIVNTDKPETKKQIKEYSGLLQGTQLDRKALSLKADYERAKANADISLKMDEQKKRSAPAKAQDVFVKWQRGFKLSNPLTIGKLMMAGATRLMTTPLEDIVGAGYSLLMPKLAKGAIGEGGGLNVNETAKAYKNGLIEGMKDAATIMKTKSSHGKSNLDTVFGKLGELPPEAIDFFGQLHSATKAPFKRFAFERSLSKRLRRNIANGVDVSDPLVQTEILTGAYKDANRAIFMQDNKVATGWQNMVRYLETHGNKGTATALQWMLPFVKIPTNIAAEIGTNVAGVPIAAGKLLHAGFTKGTENLTQDEKDIIFRSLKKGTLGLGALALGYFNPQNFGGYYQQGEKRGEDDAQAMGLKLFGVRIPAWFVESPIFQAMQIGATIRRVKDTMVKGEPKGMTEGAWAGLLGLADRVPMIDQPIRMSQVFTNAKDRQYYLGELAKSTVDPALVSYMANVTDPADKGSIAGKILNPENKRSPQTILEHIKSGIPGLRETVGVKPTTFTDEDYKDKRVSWVKKDWGMELPNTVASSENITDEDKATKIMLDKYPQDVKDNYQKVHKETLFDVLGDIHDNGEVWVKNYKNEKGEPENSVKIPQTSESIKAAIDAGYEEKGLKQLSKDERSKTLSEAQKIATTRTKKELFNQ